MRKLGKKAYRKRRKLSAVANSISAGNPGLPLLRGCTQRVVLAVEPVVVVVIVVVSVPGIKPSRGARIISMLVAAARTGRLIIRRTAGERSLSVTHYNITKHAPAHREALTFLSELARRY